VLCERKLDVITLNSRRNNGATTLSAMTLGMKTFTIITISITLKTIDNQQNNTRKIINNTTLNKMTSTINELKLLCSTSLC
jgi:hypothetical protein